MRFYYLVTIFTVLTIQVFTGKIFCQTKSNNSWERIGPGGGGATFLPTFSYQNPGQFFIRCDMTGSYLSNDGGDYYQQINFDNGASSYAFDPHNPKIIYAGLVVLNRSVDAGKTWQQIFPKKSAVKSETYYGDHAEYKIETEKNSLYEDQFPQIKNLHVDALNSSAVYFSMGNYFYYSSDACKTFKRLSLQQPVLHIYTDNNLKKLVYIFTEKVLYVFDKSSYNLSAHAIPSKMIPAFSFCAGTVSKTGKTIFYALHHQKNNLILDQYNRSEVWLSNDLGLTWQQVTDPLIVNPQSGVPNFNKISCAEFDAQHAYLISDLYEQKNRDGSVNYWYGCLKTNDAGLHWHWVWKAGGGSGQYGVKDGVDAVNLKDAWASKAFGGEFIEVEDIGVYPHNGNIAILTDWYRAMKTTDGGNTWKEIYSTQQNDGSFTSRGFDVTNAYGIHFDPFDSNHIVVSYTDIGFSQSYNRGKSWSRSVTGVPGTWVNTCYWTLFDPSVKNKLWTAWSGMHDIPRGKMTRNPSWKKNYHGGICVSIDGGKTWQPSNNGLGDDALVTSLVIDQKSAPGNRTMYAAVYNKGVFKSTDDGKTWQLKNAGIGANTCAFELTYTGNGNLFLVVSPTPDHQSKNNDSLFYSGAVYKSTDGAQSWQKLTVTNEPFFPNGIAFDPGDPDRIYLACWAGIDLNDLLGSNIAKTKGGNKNIPMKGGIFLSADAGKTWSSVFDTSQYVYDVTVDTFHKGRVYCNTFNKAAYRSDDYGKTWKQIEGYDFHWGHRIIVDQNDPEQIYITTYGSGVWHGKPIVK